MWSASSEVSFFKLWVLLLFRWVCCNKAVSYFTACGVDGNCDWYPSSAYYGCTDLMILHFSYFDLSSSLDLSCSTVQQIHIDFSDYSCDSLRRVLKGAHLPELIIGRSVCVSSNSCTFLTYSISTSSVLRNFIDWLMIRVLRRFGSISATSRRSETSQLHLMKCHHLALLFADIYLFIIFVVVVCRYP
jgi:hypothetical protein